MPRNSDGEQDKLSAYLDDISKASFRLNPDILLAPKIAEPAAEASEPSKPSKKRKKKQKTKPGASKRKRTKTAEYIIEDRTFYYFGGDCYTVLRSNERVRTLRSKMDDYTLPDKKPLQFKYPKVNDYILKLITTNNSQQTETECRESLKTKFGDNITLTPLLNAQLDPKRAGEIIQFAGGIHYAKRRTYHYFNRRCYIFLDENEDGNAITKSFNEKFCRFDEGPVWSKIADSLLQLEHPDIKSDKTDQARYRAFIRTRLQFTQAERVNLSEANNDQQKYIEDTIATKAANMLTEFFKPPAQTFSHNTSASTASPTLK